MSAVRPPSMRPESKGVWDPSLDEEGRPGRVRAAGTLMRPASPSSAQSENTTRKGGPYARDGLNKNSRANAQPRPLAQNRWPLGLYSQQKVPRGKRSTSPTS
ncbi:hypothetical protein Nepgr_002987 [Nepenthes gracilis]|uniref:Uncharacterized protein n=1 Tax=Nepenthes gracilis TaxID=150966 RepID=A0AAD3RYP4_NEPGR|nr:hypothetical protein Nepgr_002987 [Nepenthes gracilis]